MPVQTWQASFHAVQRARERFPLLHKSWPANVALDLAHLCASSRPEPTVVVGHYLHVAKLSDGSMIRLVTVDEGGGKFVITSVFSADMTIPELPNHPTNPKPDASN